MRTEHTIYEKILPTLGLLIIVPILVVMGSLAVLMLAAPVLMLAAPVVLGATVIAFSTGLLMLANALTKAPPVTEAINEEVPVFETVHLLPEAEGVEMVEALVDAPRESVTAEITKVFGPCPLGMMPGNTWRIDADGTLSRPMCRPRATALSALFGMSDGDAMNRSTACECQYANREVTFTVRESKEESLDDLVGALAEEYL